MRAANALQCLQAHSTVTVGMSVRGSLPMVSSWSVGPVPPAMAPA